MASQSVSPARSKLGPEGRAQQKSIYTTDPGLRSIEPETTLPPTRLSRDGREAFEAGLGMVVKAPAPMPMKRASLEPAWSGIHLRGALDRAFDTVRTLIRRRAV